jgi:hypothetical protein
VKGFAYQVGYHDLRLSTHSGGRCGRGSLGLLALPRRLGNTAYRSGSGGGSSSTGSATATATAGSLGRLEDIVEALLHLV